MNAPGRHSAAATSARTRRAPPSLLLAREAARPWPSLLFLSPCLAFYTAGLMWVRPDLAAGVDLLLRRALFLAGTAAVLAPAGLVVAILLGWHLVRRDPWRFPLGLLGAMVVEAAILTIPLLGLHGLFQAFAAGAYPLRVADHASAGCCAGARADLLASAMTSVGAGIYEELLFRLVLVGGLVLLAEHVFRLEAPGSAVAAVLVAAALFAGAHTVGAPQAFTWPSFLFRTAAGVYLSALFALRGFGITAGVHIVFNLLAKLLLAPAA